MVIIRTCPHTIFSDNNLAICINQCCCSGKFLFPCLVSRVVKCEERLRTVGTGHIGQLDTLSRPYVLLGDINTLTHEVIKIPHDKGNKQQNNNQCAYLSPTHKCSKTGQQQQTSELDCHWLHILPSNDNDQWWIIIKRVAGTQFILWNFLGILIALSSGGSRKMKRAISISI